MSLKGFFFFFFLKKELNPNSINLSRPYRATDLKFKILIKKGS
jgi:hypothetical protein